MPTRVVSFDVRVVGIPAARGVPMPIDREVVRRELRGELPPVISRAAVIDRVLDQRAVYVVDVVF